MADAAQEQIKAFIDRIIRLKEAGASRAQVRAAYDGLTGDQKVTVGIAVKTEWQRRKHLRVYFAAFPKAALLKIGISSNVKNRLHTLSALNGETAVLLLDFPGIFALEGWYHAHFSEHRVKGEWFALNEQTRSLVESIRIAGPAIHFPEVNTAHKISVEA